MACAVFFTRDGVTHEKALDRAKAEGETPLRQACAHLFDGGVPVWAERCHYGVMVRLDPIRTPVPAKPPGTRVALLALKLAPAADARGAHAKPLGGLAMRRASRHNAKNSNPKINRKSSRHACRPPSGRQCESLCT